MTFDIAHALVTCVLILLTIIGMERAGLYVPHKKGGPRFSWHLFLAIFVIVLILNLIWP